MDLYTEVHKNGVNEIKRAGLFIVRWNLMYHKVHNKCCPSHNLIHDIPGFMYDERRCILCNKFIDLI